MDVCPRVVLCCPVSVEALRRADPPAKESYQMSLYVDQEAHCYTCEIFPRWVGPLSPRHGAFSGCGWRKVLRLRRVAANILNKQSRTADKGWSSSLGVGRVANNPSP
jgi:hypothetical protein